MNSRLIHGWVIAGAVGILLAGCSRRFPIQKTLAAYREDGQYKGSTLRYPLDHIMGTIRVPMLSPESRARWPWPPTT
jgi:hypothetical protein